MNEYVVRHAAVTRAVIAHDWWGGNENGILKIPRKIEIFGGEGEK